MTSRAMATRLGSSGRARPRDFSRWRAASLILVHVLIAAHVTHWMVTGKTLAPLELNEVMYTFELGVVTAGFLFMAAVVLATLLVGRFFCSWGCHILALEDLSHWVLVKLRLRPRPIRSRLLLWVPVFAALYMFVWPQITRVREGRPLPQPHLRTDAQGWASLTTENFWRNLPGPGVALLTFGVCGFLIVYVLGSRGFCLYGCPYGAVFRVADWFAPGRIRAAGTDCSRCGACTAVCGSGIRVHEELGRFGMVVNSACLKDLDCVAACPKDQVQFGFGRPAILKTARGNSVVRKRFDFSLVEEGVALLVFAATVVVFRGLYDRVPFLLSLGLGSIVGALAVYAIRLMSIPDVRWNRWALKSGGRLTNSGLVFAAVVAAFGAFWAHSAFVRYHSHRGWSLAQQARGADALGTQALDAIQHLSTSRRWALLSNPKDADLEAELGYAQAGEHFRADRLDEAERSLRAALSARPAHAMAHYDLGALLVRRGAVGKGIDHLRFAVRERPDFAEGHYNLALAYWVSGNGINARREVEAAFRLNPGDEQTRRLREAMSGGEHP